MTREEYIRQRKSNNFQISTFWEYYVEEGGTIDFNSFSQLLPTYLQIGGFEKMIAKLDSKFGIVIIVENDKIIKIC